MACSLGSVDWKIRRFVIAFWRYETDAVAWYWLMFLYAAVWGGVNVFWYVFFKPFTDEYEKQQLLKMIDEIWNERVAEFRKKQAEKEI